jgi:cytochrome c oxidase cbb3-type subunit III
MNLRHALALILLFPAFSYAQPPSGRDADAPGQALFASRCGFCHGRDAAGGESGPDLTTSPLVAKDVNGDLVKPVIRDGRVDKGMPAFPLGGSDLDALVTFIHDTKKKADANPGRRRSVDVSDVSTGNADAGKAYFNGAGGCARCHQPGGDLAGVATRLKGLGLMQRMLDPGRNRGTKPNPAKVTVTTKSGETVTGSLAHRDEFTIAVTDASGWYRSFATAQVKVTVDDPLDAHREQLGKYTDKDMHDVLAYLHTLQRKERPK